MFTHNFPLYSPPTSTSNQRLDSTARPARCSFTSFNQRSSPRLYSAAAARGFPYHSYLFGNSPGVWTALPRDRERIYDSGEPQPQHTTAPSWLWNWTTATTITSGRGKHRPRVETTESRILAMMQLPVWKLLLVDDGGPLLHIHLCKTKHYPIHPQQRIANDSHSPRGVQMLTCPSSGGYWKVEQ